MENPTDAGARAGRTSANKIITLIRERWPEYVLEILVIIVSITLSFLFDEWRERQRKAEVEQFYLKGLASDIETDRRELVKVIRETELVLQNAEKLVRISERPVSPDSSRLVLDAIRFIMKRPRFIAEDVTFLDLKSTGNMQMMTNPVLKRTLFDYYNKYESVTRVENAELDAVTSISGPFLISRIPFLGGNSREVVQYLGQTPFRNILFLRQTNRTELLDGYQQLMKLALTIQKLVKKQLPAGEGAK
ncbi:hypothetical protein GCM10027299_48010 [Larkinella ripae]